MLFVESQTIVKATTLVGQTDEVGSGVVDEADIPIYVRESMNSIYQLYMPAGRKIPLKQIVAKGPESKKKLAEFYRKYDEIVSNRNKKSRFAAILLEFLTAELHRCVNKENLSIEDVDGLNNCVDAREITGLAGMAFSFISADKIATSLHNLVPFLTKSNSTELDRLKPLGNLIGKKVPLILVDQNGEAIIGPLDGWATIEEVWPQPKNSKLIKDWNNYHDFVLLKLSKPVGTPLPAISSSLVLGETIYLPGHSSDQNKSLPSIGNLFTMSGSILATKNGFIHIGITSETSENTRNGSPLLSYHGEVVGLPFKDNQDSLWAVSMDFINFRKQYLSNQLSTIPPDILAFLKELERETKVDPTVEIATEREGSNANEDAVSSQNVPFLENGIKDVVSPYDLNRLFNYNTAWQESGVQYDNTNASTIARSLWNAPKLNFSDDELPGYYRCRIIKVGKGSSIAYGWMRCRIILEGGNLILKKINGSQRKIGRFYRNNAKSMVFVGVEQYRHESVVPEYNMGMPNENIYWCENRNEVAIMHKIGRNHYTLGFPLPFCESKFDFLELTSSH